MPEDCSPIVEGTPSGFRDERLDELLSCFRFGVSCLDPFVLDKRRSKVGQCRFSMTGVPAEFFDSFLMSHDFSYASISSMYFPTSMPKESSISSSFSINSESDLRPKFLYFSIAFSSFETRSMIVSIPAAFRQL